ncbi:MAG: 30S ribosomal protein S8e [Nanoarchaeota archaeon]|nr:30S ribosomal protein S8e [Nanoarchaeota archaeon]MBU1849747.1 30S ribosomal protein S8e [Nanoarchaeota archaeon]
MVITQTRSKRKPSGGRYKVMPTKRKAQKGGIPTHTTIGEKRVRVERAIGGNKKIKLLHINKVNVMNPKTKKSSVESIKTIAENPANRHWIRRNILSKGAVIETSKGKAKVTNRPSQEGFVNAVLI